MQKKLIVEFVAYVDKSLSVNDYINPFTDEKYRESLRELINDNGGAIVLMDAEMYEMMERSSFRVPSIVLFDYEHEDTEDTKFIHSYSSLRDFLSCRNEKVFVIGGFDAWSSLVQYVSKVHFLVTDEKWGDGMTRPFLFDVREMCRITSYSELTNGITHQEYEFKDNVFMCTASVDGFGCYGVCAREPRVHVNGFGETVRRKSDHRESIVLHKGDRVFMKTDIEIYRIPKNVYVDIKTILHGFVYNGISVESSSITDGVVCVGLVNMGSKPVTIHKDQTIAVLAIRGEHEFLKVAHKEFPCEKVDGWDNYESKEDRRRSIKDERCIGNDGGDMSECCCDGF